MKYAVRVKCCLRNVDWTMTRSFILYTAEDAERNGFLIGRYRAACRARGFSLKLLLIDECPAGEMILSLAEKGSFVINRTRDAELAQRLADAGVTVSNPAEVCRTANDKLLTYERLSGLVPMLDTVPLESRDVPPLPYPFVLKPRGGHGGAGVELIENVAAFLAYTESFGSAGIIAQPVASERGRDMRVYAVGGRPVFAMLRSSDTDFRSNYCLGGRASSVPLREVERDALEIVEAVCAALPIDYCGIDIMRDGGRAILNEIEDPVGARMLYTYTDIDPAALHVGRILERL